MMKIFKRNIKGENTDSLEWERLWDEIYSSQRDITPELTEEQAREKGLVPVHGRNMEKLWINEEQSRKLFLYRISH